jgi:hypothetical protein
MNDQIKFKIKTENEKTRREKSITEAIECIDILTDNGNPLKIRELKSLSNVRDYSAIKEAIHRYENHF